MSQPLRAPVVVHSFGPCMARYTFVAFHDLDHVRRELGAEAQLLLGPLIDARERGAEDEAHDPLGAGEDVLLREHPAPGGAEQMDLLEAQLVAHGSHLVAEDRGAPVDVGRAIRVSAADLVVEDDGTLVRKRLERGEVVVCRPRPAVQGEKRRGPGGGVADDAEPGAVAAVVDVSLPTLGHGYHPPLTTPS